MQRTQGTTSEHRPGLVKQIDRKLNTFPASDPPSTALQNRDRQRILRPTAGSYRQINNIIAMQRCWLTARYGAGHFMRGLRRCYPLAAIRDSSRVVLRTNASGLQHLLQQNHAQHSAPIARLQIVDDHFAIFRRPPSNGNRQIRQRAGRRT